jgi:hypothetical protein
MRTDRFKEQKELIER